MNPISVLIADDHGVLRDGMRQLINEQPDMRVVATAADGLEAVARCEETHPDVMLLDLSMPNRGGLWALEQLRASCPETRVLILTIHDDPHNLKRCLDTGACGYLVKQIAAAEILRAIRDVQSGRSSIRVGLDAHALRRAALEREDEGPPPESLSPREREVLELLAYGYTSREIAESLQISAKSVDSYRARVYDKLDLSGRAALVRYALTYGILKADQTPPR